MKRGIVAFVIWAAVLGCAVLPSQQRTETAAPRYFPPEGSWESRPPSEFGLNAVKLDAASQFSVRNENPNTKNLAEDILSTFRNEAPYNKLIGPAQERTGMEAIEK